MGSCSLDNLAANGIIDFDAESYIKGAPAKYVGNPTGYVGLPLDRPLLEPSYQGYGVTAGAQLSGHPSNDAFVNHEETKSSGIPWKGILAGVTLGSLIIFAGVKCKKYVSKCFNKISEGFKKIFNKKSVVTNTNKVIDKAKDAAQKVKKFKIPKWVKITGGSLAGLLGLYGIYRLLSSRKPDQE